MDNEFKNNLTWKDYSQKEAANMILEKFLSTYSNYNKFNSEKLQNYFHMLIASIMLEYHKNFVGYECEIDYRFKSDKSLIDKIMDYLSRQDATKLNFKDNKTYELDVKEIKDMFAMKIIINKRPPTFYSKNSQTSNLVNEKINNHVVLEQMQEFKNKLIEDEFAIKPVYIYNVTKKEYYLKCKELTEKIKNLISEKSVKLIEKYNNIEESINETLEIIEDSAEEDNKIDKGDFPSNTVNFLRLLQDFTSRIYDKLDLDILTKQTVSLFKESELLKSFNIDLKSVKEKRTESRLCFKFFRIKNSIRSN